MASSYMNIPLAHVQGGEVTGSIDEKVRHAVTKLANLHLVSTRLASERVMRMGEDDRRCMSPGAPPSTSPRKSSALRSSTSGRSRSTAASGRTFDLSDGYLVVLQHPVTTEFEQARVPCSRNAGGGAQVGLADALVLAERRCRLRCHLRRHPIVPRARQPDNLHFFKNMRPTTSCDCSRQPVPSSATRASPSANAPFWACRR